MVTVQIKWSGREESKNERLNVVRGVVGNLPCLITSPIESNYNSYVCKNAVINVIAVFGTIDIEITGIDNTVLDYAIIVISKIKKYVENKVDKKDWGENDPETDVFADLYETEVKCGCEG